MAVSVHVTSTVLSPWQNVDLDELNCSLGLARFVQEQIQNEKQKRPTSTILPCIRCVCVYMLLRVALDAFTHGSACMLEYDGQIYNEGLATQKVASSLVNVSCRKFWLIIFLLGTFWLIIFFIGEVLADS